MRTTQACRFATTSTAVFLIAPRNLCGFTREGVLEDDAVIRTINTLTPARALQLPDQAPLAGAASAHDAQAFPEASEATGVQQP